MLTNTTLYILAALGILGIAGAVLSLLRTPAKPISFARDRQRRLGRGRVTALDETENFYETTQPFKRH